MLFKHLFLTICLPVLMSSPVFAAVSGISSSHSPGAVIVGYTSVTCTSGITGALRYNSATSAWNYCNGSAWTSLKSALPSNGYFVWSHDTHNGGLTNRAGADSWCLSQLTTNTGWVGYATANAAGQLVAAQVHAYVCDGNSCNRLKANTTYHFANAADATAGGATFTTDNMGNGPGDANNWSGATFFNISANWWAMAGLGPNPSNTVDGRNSEVANNNCLSLSSGSSGNNGQYGVTGATNSTRWDKASKACNTAYNLICYVDPYP